jgi:hypothetical protein
LIEEVEFCCFFCCDDGPFRFCFFLLLGIDLDGFGVGLVLLADLGFDGPDAGLDDDDDDCGRAEAERRLLALILLFDDFGFCLRNSNKGVLELSRIVSISVLERVKERSYLPVGAAVIGASSFVTVNPLKNSINRMIKLPFENE